MGSIDESYASRGVANIIDIRSDRAGIELKEEIKKGLHGQQKTLPTLLLYDEQGLKLFEDITYLDEYYPTNQEIAVLEQHASGIAERIADGSVLLELGSGNLRKIKILLGAIDAAGKTVDYYALDLDESELRRTLAAVPPGTFRGVSCYGLHGTFDDGLVWLNTPKIKARPKTVLFMGGSIGNFTRAAAAEFVEGFLKSLSKGDSFLIGVDGCQDADKVSLAYNDPAGTTDRFTMNGLKHANQILGYTAFDLDVWQFVAKYDTAGGKNQAFVSPKQDVEILGVTVAKDELVRIEESYKYSPTQTQELWRQAGAVESAYWSNAEGEYGLHMVQAANDMAASHPAKYAAHPVPSLEEWQALWKVWDTVTLQMIPNDELKSKPIKLRNACIFYLGHIPTFLDMKISQGLMAAPTEPSYFHSIFERGIDPDVDNPEQCHAHSEIPDEWPELNVILQYQANVRARVTDMYKSGLAYENLWAGRVLWLGLEHEAMHLETLLYMLLQSDKTLPPAGVIRPDFEQLANRAALHTVERQWVEIPAQTVNIGIDDPDTRDGPLRHFGWDVEKPERTAHVAKFTAASRPITNADYVAFLEATNNTTIPASWTWIKSTDSGSFVGNKAVRTVFGAVPLKLALHWPTSASYDELSACAQYMGGRIPTLEEARSLYEYAAQKMEALQKLGKTIPAVNGYVLYASMRSKTDLNRHLINEGVQESPPQQPSPNSADAIPDPSKTFSDLTDANVGFKHWHPVAVTQSNELAGQGEMGGLWEWTSSALTKQEGFKPMELYPAYSDDFYDDKHNVVLGGSWATHPRLAGRRSFVNWYQRNYPYVWAGARVVKDI